MDAASIAAVVEAVVTAAAFILSIVSLAKARKAEKLQSEVAALDKRLKEYELAQIEADKRQLETCTVEAKAVGSGNHAKLRIFNKGPATAYDVDWEVVTEGFSGLFVKERAPYEELRQQDHFDESVIMISGFPPKLEVITRWKDPAGNQHEQKNLLSW